MWQRAREAREAVRAVGVDVHGVEDARLEAQGHAEGLVVDVDGRGWVTLHFGGGERATRANQGCEVRRDRGVALRFAQ